jgi:hypothetical protein
MGLIEKLLSYKEAAPTMLRIVPSYPNMADADQAEFARQILSNPLFNFILASMEQELTDMWLGSEVHENETREDIHKTIKLIKALKVRFESCLTWGVSMDKRAASFDNVI